jgi:hypothetical protein
MIGKQSVGTDSIKVLDRNPMRTMLIIANDSDETVYLAIDEAAVLNQGIRLKVNDSISMFDGDPGLRGEWNAISTTGGKNLAWQVL